MKEYSNKHLTEVMCAFTFDKGNVEWDATYFGQYFEKIKELGFKNKQERKGIQVRFSGDVQELLNPQKPLVQELESQIVYKNDDQGRAIVLGDKQLSFHVIKNYSVWNNFFSELIKPGFNKYLEMQLHNRVVICQITYLNQFIIKTGENLSEYFTLFTNKLTEEGEEEFTLIDTRYKTKNNIILNLKIFANPQADSGDRIINMECSATAVAEINQVEWDVFANDVHAPIRAFFEKSITDKLRDRL